jgi:L-histidine N-alpha-methyltransferase
MTIADSRNSPLLAEILEGLSRPQKTLPPTLFYDARGSALFQQITELEEYYVTRAEAEILRDRGEEIARRVSAGAERVVFIEPGCGSVEKIGMLLPYCPAVAYVGLDVSVEALTAGGAALSRRFTKVSVLPVVGDYHAALTLPAVPDGRRIAFFPGSTIGNFEPPQARTFLARLAALVGSDGRLIIGVDLWKDPEVLRRAYDDRDGVTAAFDKNALAHLNWRFGATFDLDRFEHVSRVDAVVGRVEMHLASRGDQDFSVAGRPFRLADGETIHTENAYKYTIDGFVALAARAGLSAIASWTDSAGRFAVIAFEPG